MPGGIQVRPSIRSWISIRDCASNAIRRPDGASAAARVLSGAAPRRTTAMVTIAGDVRADRPRTTFEFYEVNDDGAPLGADRRKFTVEGDRVYVECLVAKFDDKYVEEQDLDRGTAICIFQRVFGEFQ